MQRITDKDLEAVVKRINVATESPLSSYTKDAEGKYAANVGNYHISHAYGGVALHRMRNESGGVEDVFCCGHVPKRELYGLMHAFMKGYFAQPGGNQ